MPEPKKPKAKHVFDVCGWGVWIDPLNYILKKPGTKKEYYYNSFLNLLKGLKLELDIEEVKGCASVEQALERTESVNEEMLKDLKELAANIESLGKLEWH